MSDNRLNIGPLDTAMTLKLRAYDAMKAAIVRMDIYAPDAELRLDERSLSARFGVSRTPLRYALAQLDSERLIKIVARRGIFILRKSKPEILDMIAVWAALESMAARLAADAAGEAEIARLRQLADLYAHAGMRPDREALSHADIQFHQTIVRSSGNRRIGEIIEGLSFHMGAIHRRISNDPGHLRRSADDHARIAAAIEKRDGEHAGHLVREHILMLREHVARHVDLNEPQCSEKMGGEK